jgi:hypothetical protein
MRPWFLNSDIAAIHARTRRRLSMHWMKRASSPEERERVFMAEVAAEKIQLRLITATEQTALSLLRESITRRDTRT